MDIPKTLFATLVKQGRMEMHLTQEALAEKLGISAAYLGDLERHKGGPSLELFCKTMQTWEHPKVCVNLQTDVR